MFVELLSGAGLGGASGLRPVLPTLLTGALARTDTLVDFDQTPFAFLESTPVLLGLVLIAAVLVALEQRGAITDQIATGLLGAGVVTGALLGAGVMADTNDTWWPGLIAGAAGAALVGLAARTIVSGARARLGAAEQGFLVVYTAGAALGVVAISVLFGPLSLLVFAAAVWLLVRARQRSGEKYAGLRILGK